MSCRSILLYDHDHQITKTHSIGAITTNLQETPSIWAIKVKLQRLILLVPSQPIYKKLLLYELSKSNYKRFILLVPSQPIYKKLLLYKLSKSNYKRLILLVPSQPIYKKFLLYELSKSNYKRLILLVPSRPIYKKLLLYELSKSNYKRLLLSEQLWSNWVDERMNKIYEQNEFRYYLYFGIHHQNFHNLPSVVWYW
jgi:hypothetical protein